MEPGDVDIDTWLFDADRDLGTAIAAELDIEVMLTEVRRRAARTVPTGPAHLLPDAVVAFVDGDLSARAHAQAHEHTARCAPCAAEVIDLLRDRLKSAEADARRGTRALGRSAREPHWLAEDRTTQRLPHPWQWAGSS